MEEDKKLEQQKWPELTPVIIKNMIQHLPSIFLISLAVAIAIDLFQTWKYVPMYQCQTTFAIKTNDSANNQNGEDAGEIADAFGYIISSNVFKNQMAKSLTTDISGSYFSCSVIPNTDIIQVSGISPNAKTSYQIMDYLLAHYQDISQLVLGNVNIEILQDKVAPTSPFNRLSHQRNLIYYGLMTFIVSACLAALWAYLKNTIKTKEDIQEKLQMPVFATVPMEKRYQGLKKKKSILTTQLTTSFQFVEVYKRMRVKLEEKARKHGYQVILVTSTKEGEGKSSTVANLAIALAADRQKVLVIDGDLRKPSQYRVFQLRPQNDLQYYLSQESTFQESIYHDQKTHVDILMQRKPLDNVLDTLESEQMQQLLQEARKVYDYILIDTSPAGYFNDAMILAQYSDAILLVCKQDDASTEAIYDMISKITMTGKDILGMIFNQKLPSLIHSNNSYHYYHYGYAYGYYGNYDKKKKS